MIPKTKQAGILWSYRLQMCLLPFPLFLTKSHAYQEVNPAFLWVYLGQNHLIILEFQILLKSHKNGSWKDTSEAKKKQFVHIRMHSTTSWINRWASSISRARIFKTCLLQRTRISPQKAPQIFFKLHIHHKVQCHYFLTKSPLWAIQASCKLVLPPSCSFISHTRVTFLTLQYDCTFGVCNWTKYDKRSGWKLAEVHAGHEGKYAKSLGP